MKTMTVTFENIPDDWTEEDVMNAVAFGLMLSTICKYPKILDDFLKGKMRDQDFEECK